MIFNACFRDPERSAAFSAGGSSHAKPVLLKTAWRQWAEESHVTPEERDARQRTCINYPHPERKTWHAFNHRYDFSEPELTSLPPLSHNAVQLQVFGTGIKELPELPQRLKTLSVINNQLERLPDDVPVDIERIDASRNRLRQVPPLPMHLMHLKHLNIANNLLQTLPSRLPYGLRTLLASGNRINRISQGILNCRAEIDLRRNPLSRQHVSRIMAQVRLRRLRGLPAPTLIFDELPRNAGDLAGLTDTNVHNRRLVGHFAGLMKRLVDMQPNVEITDYAELRNRIVSEFDACAARHPALMHAEYGQISVIALAKEAVDAMCELGHRNAAVGDFAELSAGRALAHVHHFIGKQATLELRDTGLVQLMRHLAFSRGDNAALQAYCPTRMIEEALTSLQSAYAFAGGVSFEVARDTLHEVGRRLVRTNPGHEKHAFIATLLHVAKTEHPLITEEQRHRYVDSMCRDHWEAYRDVALDTVQH